MIVVSIGEVIEQTQILLLTDRHRHGWRDGGTDEQTNIQTTQTDKVKPIYPPNIYVLRQVQKYKVMVKQTHHHRMIEGLSSTGQEVIPCKSDISFVRADMKIYHKYSNLI